ncbi:MAG: hypothetical protein ACK5MF_06290 [Vibrio sp.]|uniref:hypothetical protein n=1 Tax=Vibrio sp. TaxID=678 RepID=UPI003A8736E5
MAQDEMTQLKEMVSNLSRDLSIVKQAIARSSTEPTGSTTISDLPAASAEELGENPQLIFEHATGTKRGYLSQLFEQAPDLDVTDIPAANNNSSSGTGFGGIRYVKDGATLKIFVS